MRGGKEATLDEGREIVSPPRGRVPQGDAGRYCAQQTFRGKRSAVRSTAFVQDVVSSAANLQLDLPTSLVESEKSFAPTIGRVATRFDLFAQDKKNRVIVDIQHAKNADHYDRFLHYHCVAILEQVAKSYDYAARMRAVPPLLVYTVVVLTGKDNRHKKEILITDLRPRDLEGKPVDETGHKIIYLNPRYVTDTSLRVPLR